MRLADAAFPLALANGKSLITSDALAWVCFCHGRQGQLEPAERFALDALGIALQSGDDATIHARLSNLLQLSHSLHDACLQRGAECASVLVEATVHGWVPLGRLARFEAARVWEEEQRGDAAIDALRQLIETPVAHDSYYLALRAHHPITGWNG